MIVKKTARLSAALFFAVLLTGCATAPKRATRLFVAPADYISGDTDIKIHMIDVGQGDSILIQTPNGRNMLIDAGGVPSFMGGNTDTGREYVIPFLQRHLRRGFTLDAVIMSHPHADHIGGMPTVLENVKVRKVYDSGYARGDSEYGKCLEIIKRKNIDYEVVSAGDVIELDPDLEITVLSPPSGISFEGANNNSVVVRIKYKDFVTILTGDAEVEAENYMVPSFRGGLQASLLKVGHHGSRTSSTPGFINALIPEVALIPCGRNNRFGHPHSETVSRLRGADTYVYRSDYDGDVTVTSNGFSFTVRTSRR
ncbi:MAG: hypothetical protein CVU77_07810 [Elusimicrobia bacterium HGW-Elusimicrobia-1]|jgi:competence protein ComEC|nr:MAG: hypothetical protein CVU77_07810 [Elusimicrobia bacterium HGW-Elusimicrobia-1]